VVRNIRQIVPTMWKREAKIIGSSGKLTHRNLLSGRLTHRRHK
jgi:hypothetical protein